MAMGRPREFDVDKALDLALQVFWRKGYEGASMADLTETMGITKPSLYSAFGNKEELFRKALDRYVDGPGGYFQVALPSRPCARLSNTCCLKAPMPSLTRTIRRDVWRSRAP